MQDGTPLPQPSAAESARRALEIFRSGTNYERAAGVFIAAHLLVIFLRPQFFVEPLETVKFPLLVSIFPTLFWLPRAFRVRTVAMIAMLGIAAEGALWVPFAVNNRWAFEGFRVYAQMLISFVFPIILLMSYGSQLRRLLHVFLFASVFLGLYSVTHGGRGPGDFVGDENDLCLALVMLLPYALLLFTVRSPRVSRIYLICATACLLAGIIATSSRGGFIGLVGVALFLILRSPYRFRMLLLSGLLALAAGLFAPQSYWDRISSIRQVNEGSALERQETWGHAWELFLRPRNIVAGVGMRNTPIHMGEYHSSARGNLWGRQMHSLYFELLPDLGTIGALLFLLVVGASYFGNNRSLQRCRSLLDRLRYRAAQEADGSPPSHETIRPLMTLEGEARFLVAVFTAINASWIGVLLSGAFISIFYYPPIWLLTAMSGAAQLYCQRLESVAPEIIGELPQLRGGDAGGGRRSPE